MELSKSAMTRRDGQTGFTLLEVLVALTILAIALSALVKAAGDGARVAERLEGNSLAHMIAVDEMNRLRLSGEWPQAGSSSGQFEIGPDRWRWERDVETTESPMLRRVRLRITEDNQRGGQAMLVSFIHNPVAGTETDNADAQP